jgi:hypothetical protein
MIPDVGHNENNVSDWSKQWDDLFSLYALGNEAPSNLSHTNVDAIHSYHLALSNETMLHAIHGFELIDKQPDLYYGSILPKARDIYFQKNAHRELELFTKDRPNIAIHLRVHNAFDCDIRDLYANDKVAAYVDIIKNLQQKYPSAIVHIFTQTSVNEPTDTHVFETMTDVKVHKDYDTISSVHHMICADVLVLHRSSFSYMTGLYNPNVVYYIPFWHPPLSTWNSIHTLVDQTSEHVKMI